MKTFAVTMLALAMGTCLSTGCQTAKAETAPDDSADVAMVEAWEARAQLLADVRDPAFRETVKTGMEGIDKAAEALAPIVAFVAEEGTLYLTKKEADAAFVAYREWLEGSEASELRNGKDQEAYKKAVGRQAGVACFPSCLAMYCKNPERAARRMNTFLEVTATGNGEDIDAFLKKQLKAMPQLETWAGALYAAVEEKKGVTSFYEAMGIKEPTQAERMAKAQELSKQVEAAKQVSGEFAQAVKANAVSLTIGRLFSWLFPSSTEDGIDHVAHQLAVVLKLMPEMYKAYSDDVGPTATDTGAAAKEGEDEDF